MLAAKRIPVTEAVWNELSDLKAARQTYSELLEEMIEERKKARLFRDMERIEAESEFVEFPWLPFKLSSARTLWISSTHCPKKARGS